MKRALAILITAACAAGFAAPAWAQCMLANPSFEIFDGGFSGWNQFGAVGPMTSDVPHGQRAVRATGVESGAWDLSAVWQRLDAEPQHRWSATVYVWHSAAKPLTGDNLALVNIEWRDGDGQLIDYESHVAADAGTPPDIVQRVTFESQPAPPGTVATHLLLGALNSPTDPSADVFYDLVLFEDLGPPTLDELQWGDFPSGRTVEFSGRTWRTKGPGLYGPGPNLFCGTAECTWVDGSGRLHLTLQQIDGEWYSTELALEEPLGYGDYVFTTVGRLDDLHPNVVLGLFLWQYGPCYDPQNGWWGPYNEIDIEFGLWGDPANDISQFVAQPFDWPGNLERYDMAFQEQEITSHAFRWLPDRVEFRSWRGGPEDESPENLAHGWTYSGVHLPRPDRPRVHLNLWHIDDPPASDHEVILQSFTFHPHGADVPTLSQCSLIALAGLLLAAGLCIHRSRSPAVRN